jgi:hypothetical protein
VVFGVLRWGEWGWAQPKAGAPVVLGVSPVVWLILGGLVVLWLLVRWEVHVEERGGARWCGPGSCGTASSRAF